MQTEELKEAVPTACNVGFGRFNRISFEHGLTFLAI
jgi:hypothetical protein